LGAHNRAPLITAEIWANIPSFLRVSTFYNT
jgi:hypothetical protein